MMRSNKQIRIGIALIVALGVLVEVLKLTHVSIDQKKFSVFGIETNDDEQSLRTAAQRARTRLLNKKNESNLDLPNPQMNSQINSQIKMRTPVDPIIPVANLGDPKVVNAKLTRKTAEVKKKKKKKKETAVAKGAEQHPEQQPNGKSESYQNSGSSSHSPSGGGLVSGSFQNKQNPESFNEDPQTLEEWVKYILREPNYERTMRLIEKQQINALKNEIFHHVVAEMLSDTRPKMHEYAVLALGSTPSYKSFLMLQQTQTAQAAALAFPDGLKQQVQIYLQLYARLENLRFLAIVIGSNSGSEPGFEALRLIQLAARSYLAAPTANSNGVSATQSAPSGAPSGAPAGLSRMAREFNPLIPLLNRLSQTSPDANLLQEASQTLNRIQSAVGEPAV